MVKKKIIAIDPGHRRSTPGKAVHPYYEWESNQRIALILKKILEASGFVTFFTIDINSDWDKPIYSRGVAARQADLLVSLHNNAHGDPDVTGTETFVHSNSTASVPVAQAIQSAMVKSLGTKNRGVKKADFGVLRGAYQYTLAVLLEGEFFTNARARKWMMTKDFELRYAAGAAKGICDYFNYKFVGAVFEHAKQPSAPIKNPDRADMVKVITANLYTYNSKNWYDKGVTVEKDESFTIAATHIVAGSKMYELVSGLYITANPKFVEFLPGAMVAEKPKEVITVPKETPAWKVEYDRQVQRAKELGFTDGTRTNEPLTREEGSVIAVRVYESLKK